MEIKNKMKSKTDKKNKQPPIAEFRTTEIQLVAWLRYNNLIVQQVNKLGSRQAEFVFHNVDRDLLEMFNSDNASVEPKMYASIMRQQTQAAKRVIKEES